MSDHYRTLGVQPNASKSDIRNAYFRLAHRYHPDHHAQADAASRAAAAASFRRAKDAYDVLSDDVRRDEYDRIFRTSSFDSGNRHGPYDGGRASSSASGNRHGPYGGGASSSSTDREPWTSKDGEADWRDVERYYLKKLRQLQEERERERRPWNQQGQTSSTRSSSTAWGQGGGPRSPPRPMATGTPIFLCW
jgi:DnaJ-class molecular chaperone